MGKNEENIDIKTTAEQQKDTPIETNTTKYSEKEAKEALEEIRKQEIHKRLAAETKKEISVTRALVLFGFESWLALEPGKEI